ncbi:MAG TPA: HAMP domain-containing protein [Nannocystis exedens]|nr:HAMP domain-containing protein [Nannocystis exedens]
MPWSSLRTKLVLVAGVSVAAGLLLSGGAAYLGLQSLGRDAGEETRKGLRYTSQEYLQKHIGNVAQLLSIEVSRAEGELATLSAVLQTAIDYRQELGPFLDAAAKVPLFADHLVYHAAGNWAQTGPDEPSTVTVWGYLLDKADKADRDDSGDSSDKTQETGESEAAGEVVEHSAKEVATTATIRADVRRAIDDTAFMDLLMPPIHRYGSRKLQIYFVGPTERPFARFFPTKKLAQTLDTLAPGHNEAMFWDFFFPGLVDGWKKWVGDSSRFVELRDQITLTAPYYDAAGGGPIVTLFQPLWSRDRTHFAGALGFDLTLKGIIDYVEEVKLFGSGFAFLAQDNGNVFAVNEAGRERLGLTSVAASGGGVDIFEQYLGKSTEAATRALVLPTGKEPVFLEVELGGRNHVVALQRLDPFNAWSGGDELHKAHWVIGFVVPDEEIYAALTAAEKAVALSSQKVLALQVGITLATLAVVLLWLILVSRRLTASLVTLSRGASRIANKDYRVSVPTDSLADDEVGALTLAFNQMASEIREHTENLEGLVHRRTSELEDANREIIGLNERLKVENLRMGAELDVARRLQMMVLPTTAELEAVHCLDIAGFMQPAEEVGGDYYDVLQGARALKIAIGDVTGHGLESGVLMLMVQTAVRTLLTCDVRSPRRFLSLVNQVIFDNLARIGVDRTLTLSLLDYADGVLVLAGQHEEVLIARVGGEVERIDTMDLGLPIGIERDIDEFIDLQEIALGLGDVVALYTDGITEAESPSGEFYGIDRLCACLGRVRDLDADGIRDAVVADVRAHIGGAMILDDITTVILKRIA